MRKRLRGYCLSLMLLLSLGGLGLHSTNVEASKRQSSQYFHAYLAAGPLFGLGAIRGGGKNFEVGLLSADGMLGACGLFNINQMLFAEFGAGLSYAGVGLFAGLGAEFYSLSIVDFRFELTATSVYNNYTAGSALIGININF